MGSAFHQLFPRYSGTLTLTAPIAITAMGNLFFLSFKRIILKQLLTTEANVYLQHFFVKALNSHVST